MSKTPMMISSPSPLPPHSEFGVAEEIADSYLAREDLETMMGRTISDFEAESQAM